MSKYFSLQSCTPHKIGYKQTILFSSTKSTNSTKMILLFWFWCYSIHNIEYYVEVADFKSFDEKEKNQKSHFCRVKVLYPQNLWVNWHILNRIFAEWPSYSTIIELYDFYWIIQLYSLLLIFMTELYWDKSIIIKTVELSQYAINLS